MQAHPNPQYDPFQQQPGSSSEYYSNHDNNDQPHVESNLLKNVRAGFVKKVFSILSIQLAFTALMIFMSQTSIQFRKFQINNVWLLTMSSFVIIAISISMYCVQALTKRVPYNYITLSIFTIAEGYSVSAFTLAYDQMIVLKAALLVAGATLLLFVYACTTKRDVTVYNSVIFLLFSSFTLVSIINLFVRNNFVMMIIEYATVLIYSFYLIYDIQLIMGQKNLKLDLDNYILGSLIIYLDIIQLFIKILQLLGKKENEEKDKKKK